MTASKGKNVKGPLHHAIEGAEHTVSGLEERCLRWKKRVLGDLDSVFYEI